MTALEKKAKAALIDFAGCGKDRAAALVKAVKTVAENESLETITGGLSVYGGMLDTRVERLNRLVIALRDQAAEETKAGKEAVSKPLPNVFEIGTLWRVTPGQAASIQRTWRARYPEIYEERLSALASDPLETKPSGPKDDPHTKVVYGDPDVLAYAEARARRKGLSKGLRSNPTDLTLEAPDASTSLDGESLKGVLGIP